ncbi:MAG TPA: gluconeogenesis factor YvcK family protein [Spirochaetia bacterium]|nr:gluconeogenesis factor YvcK family protein [Spirochaetia bacterium]
MKWLYPGLRVKRWLILALAGMMLLLVAGSFFQNAQIAAAVLGPSRHSLEWFGAGALLALLGFALLLAGLYRAFRSVVTVLLPEEQSRLVDIIFARRYLKRGPRIVVIGGGTGLSVLLRGLKAYTANITAVVSVADDGGSSGRLREDLGILPPGDIRNCLIALADKETLMEKVLQYRFGTGELAGHSLGNLMLAALTEVTGNFFAAVQGLSKVLAVRGRVLPVTLANVVLGAVLADGSVLKGQCHIARSPLPVERVFLLPAPCRPPAEVLAAIREADAVVLGPGSLYTSVIPNLLVEGIPEAINQAPGIKIYVVNVMTQPGETAGYTAADHFRAILAHAPLKVNCVLVNQQPAPGKVLERYREEGSAPVQVDLAALEALGVRVVGGRLLREGDLLRHDPELLGRAVLELVLAGQGRAGRMGLIPFRVEKKIKELLKNVAG